MIEQNRRVLGSAFFEIAKDTAKFFPQNQIVPAWIDGHALGAIEPFTKLDPFSLVGARAGGGAAKSELMVDEPVFE